MYSKKTKQKNFTILFLKNFMQSLKVFRKINGITQQDLATYLGTTKGFISQVENGISKFPIHLLNKIYENTNGWNTSCLPSINENPTSSTPQEAPAVAEEVIGEEVPMAIPILPPLIVDQPNISIKKEIQSNSSDFEKLNLHHLIQSVDVAYRVLSEKLAPYVNIGDILLLRMLTPEQEVRTSELHFIDTKHQGTFLRYTYDEGDSYRLAATNRSPECRLPKDKVTAIFLVVCRITFSLAMPDYLANKQIRQQGKQITSLVDSVNNLVTATIDEGKRTDRVLDLLEKEIERNAKK